VTGLARRLELLAGLTVGAGAAVTGVTAAYLGALGIAASRRRPVAAPAEGAPARIVVMVPAHNEAAVIALTLTSLRAQRYPADRFDVHVVCDNCTDDTAQLVRDAGWNAHERADLVAPGKGHALNWLFDRLVTDGQEFDAIAYVDADTVVDPDFLAAIDGALRAGAVAVQGRYLVHEAEASAAASIRLAALACRHDLRAAGRTAIGGSCGLFGNGMAFRREVMAHRRWSGHLVEDAEFQNELLLDGVLVAYAPAARVEAEMPHDLVGATSQNERWERGRIEIARRYVPRLGRIAVSGSRRGPSRVAALDAVADHLVPPLSVVVATDIAVGVAALGLTVASSGRAGKWSLVVSALSGAVLVAHVLTALRRIDAPRSAYRALLSAPRAVLWKLALVARIARSDDVAWTRTERNADRTP
jgi:1,2-diacylglycerol 3-beta-glucosyltransferase